VEGKNPQFELERAGMKQVYAFLGNYYHPFEHVQSAIQLAFEHPILKENFVLHISDVNELVPILQLKPDCVILFKEDRVNPNEAEVQTWMTDDIAAEITRYVEYGGSWLAWHSGLASYNPDGEFVQMLRGYFQHHPALNQPVIYTAFDQINPEGNVKFEILDEHYFVYCDEASTEIFLLSESIDGKSIAGWRHSFGLGKVCCLTPAHRKEGLQDSNVISILAENIRWCCNKIY
jgi:type 1 glutamine amidotransferase